MEQKLSEHYPHLVVKVRAAALIDGEGIEVRGLSFSQPNATGPRAELAHFDELMFYCDTRLPELMQHEPEVSKIVVRRPVFLATRREDGSWSTGQLLPLPHLSNDPPTILVEGCRFEFFDPLRNPTATLLVRDVHLQITAKTPDVPGQGEQFAVRGFMTGDFFQRIEFEGQLSPDGLTWQFGGTVEGLDLSPEFYAALPGPLADQLSELSSLRARSRFRFHIAQQQRQPFEFDLDGQLARGRIEDSRLPYPLTDLFARVRLTNAGVHVSDLRARNGQTVLAVREAWRKGYSDESPLFADIDCQRLVIDRRLLESLPENMQVNCYDYSLAGTVDLKAVLFFDGQKWKPDVALRCIDTSFTYHKFPYRLENGQGSLRLKDDVLDFWLTAYSGADQVTLKAQVYNVSDDPRFWMELQAAQVAIDRKLLEALPSGPRSVIESLRPAGRFSLYAAACRQGSGQPLEHRVRIGLDHCSIRYDKFAFPIYNVCGTVELAGDVWEFRNLEGNNDTAAIRGHGRLGPTPQGMELSLHLAASSVALEDELRNALPTNIQQFWESLGPRGKVNLATDLRYLVDPKRLHVSLGLAPQGDSVSIEPRFFPYRIDAIQGEIGYEDGKVVLGRRPGGLLRGRHQGVDVALRGECDLLGDGTWRMALEDFSVYRLRADRDLQAAVSPKLNQWLRKLDPNEPLNMRGRLTLVGSGQPGESPRADWQASVTLHRARFNGMLPLENVFGLAHVSGQFDGQRLAADVELDLDSLTCRDLQLTRITGPLRIDNDQVLLGAWAEKGDSSGRHRPITAQAYNGWLLSDGWIRLEDVPRFGVQLTAGDIDVQQLARESLPGAQQLTGKANAGVNLRGTTEGLHTLSGTGYMRLRDADIYRLPQMVALLNILSLKPPDKASLTHSEADFRIDGEHIYFDRINFSGDAISLRGQGEMNFATDLALTLYASVGRGELQIPLIPDLFRAASQQIMLIHVNGKMSDPLIQRDPFPMVNQAISQLSADLSGARAAAGASSTNDPTATLGQRRGAGTWLNNPEARPIFPLQPGRTDQFTR